MPLERADGGGAAPRAAATVGPVPSRLVRTLRGMRLMAGWAIPSESAERDPDPMAFALAVNSQPDQDPEERHQHR